MNARVPAEVFAPGEFLDEELKARGWSQTEFAEILGRPPRVVNEIIAGKRAITPDTAVGFAAALGTSAQYWLNLESSYQLSRAAAADSGVTRRAVLYGMFPVKDLTKRGWVAYSDSIETLESSFLEFFGMASMAETPTFAHAARATSYDDLTIAKLAWLNRARQVAAAVVAGKYSAKLLTAAVEELRTCMEYPEDIKSVSTILANAGVKIVVVEQLPGTRMDGACFWVGGTPVVALTLRYDRIDNFWFNLFHEIDHVLHDEGKDNPICEEIEQSAEGLPAHEVRANTAAAAYCIPQDEMEHFIARVGPLYSKETVVGFARRLRIHPGLVVGQLQNRKLIAYSFHRPMLEKIRTVATRTILTDGFGQQVPIGRGGAK